MTAFGRKIESILTFQDLKTSHRPKMSSTSPPLKHCNAIWSNQTWLCCALSLLGLVLPRIDPAMARTAPGLAWIGQQIVLFLARIGQQLDRLRLWRVVHPPRISGLEKKHSKITSTSKGNMVF